MMLLSAMSWLQIILFAVTCRISLCQGSVDLTSPIDVLTRSEKYDQTPSSSKNLKARIVVLNNRREARLPFHDPRKSLRSNHRQSSRSQQLNRRGSLLENGNRRNVKFDSRRNNFALNKKMEIRENDRKQEIEREVKKALERRNFLLSNEKYLNYGRTSGNEHLTEDSTTDHFSETKGSHRSSLNQRFQNDRRPISSWSDSTDNSDFVHRYGDKWTDNTYGQVRAPMAQSSQPLRYSQPNENNNDRRKAPILIFEKVPVYITNDDIPETTHIEPKAPLDHYEPNRSEDTIFPIDRRPGRFYSDENEPHQNPLSVISYQADHHSEPPYIYEETIVPSYDDEPGYYESYPPNIFPNNAIPYDSANIGYEDVYHPHHAQNIGPPLPVPGILVPGEPLPHIVQEVIADESILDESSAKLAFQQRLQAAAAAGALRQQALAGLAFNQRLQQIAAIRGLQRRQHHQASIAAARARQASSGNVDLHNSASGAQGHFIKNDYNYVLKSLGPSDAKDTITNQLNKHVDAGLEPSINRDELVRHLLRLR